MNPKLKLVQRGYDQLGLAYAFVRDQFKSDRYLQKLAHHLKPGATVLDVGCGAGAPVAKSLADRGLRVTGVDISTSQIELARRNVPAATFQQMDITDLVFPAGSFDALVSFYAVFHVPRQQHPRLLRKFAKVLKPGGYLLVTMGVEEWEGLEDFHGVEMFWSHYGRERNLSIIRDAGFRILNETVDSSGGEKHLIVHARKLMHARRKAQKTQTVRGVRYNLIHPSRIRGRILAMADKEWDLEDFVRHGKELRNVTWTLETVKVQNVKMRPELIRSREFRNDLRPRIKSQLKLIRAGQPILPLVLRGKDLLIFDGYARLHALQRLGANECLAYVGRGKRSKQHA